MRMTQFKSIIATFALMALSVGVFSSISAVNAAFGTSPPWVKNDHLLPGTNFEQVVTLSRSDTEEAMKASIKISGDKNLLKWIEIENEDDLIMEEGQKVLPMKVLVDIPKRAALKRYTGSIFVTLSSVTDEDLGGGVVGITLGANINIDIEVVGDKVVDYWIKSASVVPLQEGAVFGLGLEVQNLGNTEIEKIDGQIDIYDNEGKEILHSLTFPTFKSPIENDATDYTRMVFKEIKLAPGEYEVHVKVFKDEETVYENRLIQVVKEKVIPVITPEDAVSEKPSLPGESAVSEPTPSVDQTPIVDLKPAAPVDDSAKNAYLIFGLVGLGIGLASIITLIVVLIIVLKNQQRTAIRNDSTQIQPIQNQPAQNQPENIVEKSSSEEGNTNFHAENKE